jgi:hypothetical protein
VIWDLFFDMIVAISLISLLQCPIMHYSLQTVCIQSVSGGYVTILGGHSAGNSKQKLVYVHVSYSEPFLRKSYFTVQEFRFSDQNCPSLTPYCALLDFYSWGWMKSEVHKIKVDTRDKLCDHVMDDIASIKGSYDALRRATRHVLTRDSK